MILGLSLLMALFIACEDKKDHAHRKGTNGLKQVEKNYGRI